MIIMSKNIYLFFLINSVLSEDKINFILHFDEEPEIINHNWSLNFYNSLFLIGLIWKYR